MTTLGFTLLTTEEVPTEEWGEHRPPSLRGPLQTVVLHSAFLGYESAQ